MGNVWPKGCKLGNDRNHSDLRCSRRGTERQMRIPVQLKDPAPKRPQWWQSLQQIYQQAARTINGDINIIPQMAPALSTTHTPLPGDNVANAHAKYVTGTPGTDD